MTADRRLVRRLRVCGPTDTLVRRGIILLEDAFNTASLPGGSGSRVILIRRLAVGRIRSSAASSQVALAIERRLWELASGAVHAGDPSAGDAAAVYFRDAGEAHVALAVRLARGVAPVEWFWRPAVPAWRAGSAPDEALRDLRGAIMRLEAAPVVMAQLILALAANGVCDVLLARLRRDEGAAMLSAFGWRFTASEPRHTIDTAAVDTVAPSLAFALDTWVERWGATDERALWLAAMVLVASGRQNVACTELVARAGRLVSSRTATRVGRQAEAVHSPDSGSAYHGSPAPAASDGPRGVHGERTRGAGLLFLLPALARLGLPELLESHPELTECDLAARLLTAAADRVGIPEDDPVYGPLIRPPFDQTFTISFTAPARWQHGICRPGSVIVRGLATDPDAHVAFDATGRLPIAMWRGAEPHDLPAFGPRVADSRPLEAKASVLWLMDAWLIALRRWCRRYARVGLRDLICRPGRILPTSTHLDVVFDHCCVDTRVRRAGLDLDPGWIPWFGRVVTFHYTYE
jgi:hypothetical protein